MCVSCTGYQAGTVILGDGTHRGVATEESGCETVSVPLRPPTATIPDAPGSYQFLDGEGRVLYVGKAKSLRSRLNSYFQDPAGLANRTAQMVAQAESVEWVVVSSELEALMLEYSLIQRHKPRFNVRLKDDKSYPYVAVTVNEPWARPLVYRGKKRKGVRYFGPYGHVKSLRSTLDLLVKSFPVRTCSDNKMRRHERLGRPCLLFDIGKCCGPCIGAVTPEEYQAHVNGLLGFLDGDTDRVEEELRAAMNAAAEDLDYERAARLRDRIAAVHQAGETQIMVSGREESFDVIGIAQDELEAGVCVFHVHRGRVVGRSGFVVDKVEELTDASLLTRIIQEVYGPTDVEVPRRIYVPTLPSDVETLTTWLIARREGPVEIVVPQRGEKRELEEMVTNNAAEDLARHRLRRASDHNARSRALTELQEYLGLKSAPLRIECYDMSHLQGSDYVGSMVVFEDALAKKSDYRKFVVRTVPGNDDYAAMEEVLTRRLSAMVEGAAATDTDDAVEEDEEETAASLRQRRRFAYNPQLLLIDGGKGQLGVAVSVLERLGLSDRVEVASLAKQFEEVYRPGRSDPIRIPRGSEALYLLQRLRDEAHRFAISFHRQRRGAHLRESVLDTVKGLGPIRRERLLSEVGSLAKLRRMQREEFDELGWLPESVVKELYDALHPGLSKSAVPANVITMGENETSAEEVGDG